MTYPGIQQVIKRDYAETLILVRQHMTDFNALNEDREGYMVDTVPTELNRIMQDHPDLSKKNQIRSLWILGSAHKPVERRLSERGYVVTVSENDHPIIEFQHEAELLLQSGEWVPDELAGKVVIEMLFSRLFATEVDNICTTAAQEVQLKRKLINPLPGEIIERMYPYVWKAKSVDVIKKLFLDVFDMFGGRLPETTADFEAYINS